MEVVWREREPAHRGGVRGPRLPVGRRAGHGAAAQAPAAGRPARSRAARASRGQGRPDARLVGRVPLPALPRAVLPCWPSSNATPRARRRSTSTLAEDVRAAVMDQGEALDYTQAGTGACCATCCAWLEDHGVLQVVDGDREAFVTADPARSRRSTTSTASGWSGSRRASWIADADREELRTRALAEPSTPSDEARRTRLRLHTARRLAEDPAVYFKDLSLEEQLHFRHQRRAIADRVGALSRPGRRAPPGGQLPDRPDRGRGDRPALPDVPARPPGGAADRREPRRRARPRAVHHARTSAAPRVTC